MTTKTLHRTDDHETSIYAASRILQSQSELKKQILRVLRRHPEGLTDRELEQQPEFEARGPSTVRKRRGELVKSGLVEATGEIRDGLKIWKAVPITEVVNRHKQQRSGCLF